MPCYDADFYPYGVERTPIVNSCSQNYKFTGKERDSESGLDNFGARFNTSTLGRFMSIDPMGATSAHVTDPQRWNRYSYVSNNPLARLDTSGRAWDPWQHVSITERAFAQAHITVDRGVVIATRDRDGGGMDGHNPYTSPLLHLPTWHREQYSHGTQANHFLRDKGQSQQEAYHSGVDQLVKDAGAARLAMKEGYSEGLTQARGDALHLIEDSYAHTDRVAGKGAITHIQCFNCSKPQRDHHHPDLEVHGALTNEGQGSVTAAAAYLAIIYNPSLTDDQFRQALEEYIKQYFQNGLDEPSTEGALWGSPSGVAGCPGMACKQ